MIRQTRQASAVVPSIPIPPRPLKGASIISSVAMGLFARLIAWSERGRMRHRLRDLDDRSLEDIGLSRDAIRRESEKPFWRP